MLWAATSAAAVAAAAAGDSGPIAVSVSAVPAARVSHFGTARLSVDDFAVIVVVVAAPAAAAAQTRATRASQTAVLSRWPCCASARMLSR